MVRQCIICSEVKSVDLFNKSSQNKGGIRYNCKLCHRKDSLARQRLNPEKHRSTCNKWVRNNRAICNFNLAKYRAAKFQATPKWLSKQQLKEIEQYYIDAAYIQRLMQTPMEVDHILPLQGKEVKGLHVPWNLQILTAEENERKSNKIV